MAEERNLALARASEALEDEDEPVVGLPLLLILWLSGLLLLGLVWFTGPHPPEAE